MKSAMIKVFIFVRKQNVSEIKSDRHFGKDVKACLQNKKVYLMPLQDMVIFI